jgi:hypothetical protein
MVWCIKLSLGNIVTSLQNPFINTKLRIANVGFAKPVVSHIIDDDSMKNLVA